MQNKHLNIKGKKKESLNFFWGCLPNIKTIAKNLSAIHF